jgi:hypothetical protein
MKLSYFLSAFLTLNTVEAISIPTAASVVELSKKAGKMGAAVVLIAGSAYCFAYDLILIGGSHYFGDSGIVGLRTIEKYPIPSGYMPCVAHTPEQKAYWRNDSLQHGFRNLFLDLDSEFDHFKIKPEQCFRYDSTGKTIAVFNDVSLKFSKMHWVLQYWHDSSLDLYEPMFEELMENAYDDEAILKMYDEKFLPLRAKIIADAKRELRLRALADIAILSGIVFLSATKLMKK